jgi:hypothetical protein
LAGRIKKKKRVAVNRVCLRPTRTPRVCFEWCGGTLIELVLDHKGLQVRELGVNES